MGLFDRLRHHAPEPPPSPDVPRRLALYKFDACPFCRRVQLALDDLDIDDITFYDTRRDPERRRELMALTGRTQVPCLFIDEVPLFESRDIVKWLQAYDAAQDRGEERSKAPVR